VPDDFASGDEVFELDVNISYTTGADVARHEMDPWYTVQSQFETLSMPITWNSIFAIIGPNLFDESTQRSVVHSFSNRLATLLLNEGKRRLPVGMAELTSARPSPEHVETLFIQLFALGLIAHGTRERSADDENKYWKLTQLGQDTLMKLRAIRKASSVGTAAEPS
jgi:hypothetical protein